ncbi:MAG: hypothetical protein H6560_16230 [Lewinellaceae bacterium]|nr:hypothetical protein [Lewinellaceae bacterium]
MKHLYHYLLAFTLVQLFYFPTWDAGFVTDFTGLQWRLEGSGAAGILNSFGFPSLQPVLNAFLYLFYHAFGLNPLPWYLVFTGLHALNGLLVYRFGNVMLQAYGARAPQLAALLAAAFFLLSPYQSEAVTWRVCFNFLFSSFLILSVLWLVQAWIKEGRAQQLWAVHLLFVLALFTFELALMAPLACLLLLVSFPKEQRAGGKLSRQLGWLAIPQFGMILVYFLLNRLILGSWVGHYGAAVHLKFQLREVLSHYFLYGIKHLAFSRYWPHPWKEGLVNWLQQPALLYPLAIGFGLCLAFLLLRFYRWRGEGKASLLFLLLFILALAPVANLYFHYLLHVENDRYGYLASAFLFLGFSTVLSFLPRRFYLLLAIGYLGLSGFFLRRTNQWWQQSTAIYYRLLDGFRWYEAPAVYLLNLPANYQGVLMFHDFSGEGVAFRDALKYIRRKPYEGDIYEIAQYNLATPKDDVSVRIDSTNELTVTFNQWGNWWWHKGLGMGGGYKTEQYQVINHGQDYRLVLDSIPDGAVFLYQTDGEWEAIPGEAVKEGESSF